MGSVIALPMLSPARGAREMRSGWLHGHACDSRPRPMRMTNAHNEKGNPHTHAFPGTERPESPRWPSTAVRLQRASSAPVQDITPPGGRLLSFEVTQALQPWVLPVPAMLEQILVREVIGTLSAVSLPLHTLPVRDCPITLSHAATAQVISQ